MPDNDALVASLTVAVAAAPQDVPLRLHLARLCAGRGAGEDAVRHTAAALVEQPEHPEAGALMRRLLAGTGVHLQTGRPVGFGEAPPTRAAAAPPRTSAPRAPVRSTAPRSRPARLPTHTPDDRAPVGTPPPPGQTAPAAHDTPEPVPEARRRGPPRTRQRRCPWAPTTPADPPRRLAPLWRWTCRVRGPSNGPR